MDKHSELAEDKTRPEKFHQQVSSQEVSAWVQIASKSKATKEMKELIADQMHD